jgi:hypothetical protein
VALEHGDQLLLHGHVVVDGLGLPTPMPGLAGEEMAAQLLLARRSTDLRLTRRTGFQVGCCY